MRIVIDYDTLNEINSPILPRTAAVEVDSFYDLCTQLNIEGIPVYTLKFKDTLDDAKTVDLLYGCFENSRLTASIRYGSQTMSLGPGAIYYMYRTDDIINGEYTLHLAFPGELKYENDVIQLSPPTPEQIEDFYKKVTPVGHRAQIGAIVDPSQELLKTIKSLQTSVSKLKSDNASLTSERNSLGQDLQQKIGELQTTTNQLSQAKSKLQAALNDLDQVKQELQQVKTNSSAGTSTQSEREIALNKQIDELQKKINGYTDEIAHLQSSKNGLSQQLVDTDNALQEAKRNLDAQVAARTADIVYNTSVEVTNAKNAAEALKSANTELNNQIVGLTEKNTKLAKDNQTMTTSIDNLMSENTRLNNEIARLNTAIENLKVELEEEKKKEEAVDDETRDKEIEDKGDVSLGTVAAVVGGAVVGGCVLYGAGTIVGGSLGAQMAAPFMEGGAVRTAIGNAMDAINRGIENSNYHPINDNLALKKTKFPRSFDPGTQGGKVVKTDASVTGNSITGTRNYMTGRGPRPALETEFQQPMKEHADSVTAQLRRVTQELTRWRDMGDRNANRISNEIEKSNEDLMNAISTASQQDNEERGEFIIDEVGRITDTYSAGINQEIARKIREGGREWAENFIRTRFKPARRNDSGVSSIGWTLLWENYDARVQYVERTEEILDGLGLGELIDPKFHAHATVVLYRTEIKKIIESIQRITVSQLTHPDDANLRKKNIASFEQLLKSVQDKIGNIRVEYANLCEQKAEKVRKMKAFGTWDVLLLYGMIQTMESVVSMPSDPYYSHGTLYQARESLIEEMRNYDAIVSAYEMEIIRLERMNFEVGFFYTQKDLEDLKREAAMCVDNIKYFAEQVELMKSKLSRRGRSARKQEETTIMRAITILLEELGKAQDDKARQIIRAKLEQFFKAEENLKSEDAADDLIMKEVEECIGFMENENERFRQIQKVLDEYERGATYSNRRTPSGSETPGRDTPGGLEREPYLEKYRDEIAMARTQLRRVIDVFLTRVKTAMQDMVLILEFMGVSQEVFSANDIQAFFDSLFEVVYENGRPIRIKFKANVMYSLEGNLRIEYLWRQYVDKRIEYAKQLLQGLLNGIRSIDEQINNSEHFMNIYEILRLRLQAILNFLKKKESDSKKKSDSKKGSKGSDSKKG